HNRAVIEERSGDRAAALADYRKALEVSPTYEASRTALQRLGAGADAPAPAGTAEDVRARSLAEQASVAARRGDYAGATRLLDDAARPCAISRATRRAPSPP